MYRRTTLMAAAVAAALVFTTPANPQSVGQLSGGFVARFEYGPDAVGTAYINLHSDGTVTHTTSNASYSSIHGVWEKSGHTESRII